MNDTTRPEQPSGPFELKRLVGLVRANTAADDDPELSAQIAAVRAIAEREGVALELVRLAEADSSRLHLSPEWAQVQSRLDVPGTHLAVDVADRLFGASRPNLTILADLQRRGTRVYTSAGNSDLEVMARILALVSALR